MVELYQSSKANVSEHIAHIFEEGELVKEAVVRKFRTTASDGKALIFFDKLYEKMSETEKRVFYEKLIKEV